MEKRRKDSELEWVDRGRQVRTVEARMAMAIQQDAKVKNVETRSANHRSFHYLIACEGHPLSEISLRYPQSDTLTNSPYLRR